MAAVTSAKRLVLSHRNALRQKSDIRIVTVSGVELAGDYVDAVNKGDLVNVGRNCELRALFDNPNDLAGRGINKIDTVVRMEIAKLRYSRTPARRD